MHAKSRQQMAVEYGINRKTFCKWCKEADIKLPVRKLIPPKLQNIIYEKLGQPKSQ